MVQIPAVAASNVGAAGMDTNHGNFDLKEAQNLHWVSVTGYWAWNKKMSFFKCDLQNVAAPNVEQNVALSRTLIAGFS